MLTLTYIVFAGLGVLYILIAAFLGNIFHFDGGGHGHVAAHDAGSPGGESYGVQHGGHGHASAGGGESAAFHFPFFSPLALATLFTAIGAFGLIGRHGLRVSEPASLALAVPAALATTYAVTYAAFRLVRGSLGTSTLSAAVLMGATGEVTTPIPANGIGEVMAMIGAERLNAPARSLDGNELPRGAVVTVVEIAGSTFVVKRKESSHG